MASTQKESAETFSVASRIFIAVGAIAWSREGFSTSSAMPALSRLKTFGSEQRSCPPQIQPASEAVFLFCGHIISPMSAIGTKQTSICVASMSALEVGAGRDRS
jgi:hypothetical protein